MKSCVFVACCLTSFLSFAVAQTPVLQETPPVVLKAHKLQPFELHAGTSFNLVLENASDLVPSAMVSSDVLDFYQNVTVPRGSRLAGKYLGFMAGRHLVAWDTLQMPGNRGSLSIDPPLLGTMRDGTTGYMEYSPGAAVGATNTKEFIVPH